MGETSKEELRAKLVAAIKKHDPTKIENLLALGAPIDIEIVQLARNVYHRIDRQSFEEQDMHKARGLAGEARVANSIKESLELVAYEEQVDRGTSIYRQTLASRSVVDDKPINSASSAADMAKAARNAAPASIPKTGHKGKPKQRQ